MSFIIENDRNIAASFAVKKKMKIRKNFYRLLAVSGYLAAGTLRITTDTSKKNHFIDFFIDLLAQLCHCSLYL